jgi:hypothetical protein
LPDSLRYMAPISPRKLRAPNGTSRKTALFIASSRSRKSLWRWVIPTLRTFPARSPGKKVNLRPSSVEPLDPRRREATPNRISQSSEPWFMLQCTSPKMCSNRVYASVDRGMNMVPVLSIAVRIFIILLRQAISAHLCDRPRSRSL